ncbi:uncharacterized protein LOC131206498 [Anopheles bellator]|uniref:uncharacterized protein LOC131206498 n=1 Tax=Anopheles bellator TaxID=139047 RepID=UPI00264A3968|nr:uncharacterized protein LOC131206498 [Anopheles bellator]
MTRIRTDSIGLRSGGVSEPTASTGSSYEGLVTPSPEATETAVVMESSIMDTGLPNDAGEMVVAVEDVVSSIHQSAVALMNGVANAGINNNNNNNTEGDKRTDKSAKRDQRSQIIDDFASNDDDGHGADEEQRRAVTAIHAHDSAVEMRCYAAAASGGGNVDNEQHSIGMLVDGVTVGATEIAIESISETVVDEAQHTETIIGEEEVPDVPFQDSTKQQQECIGQDDDGDDDEDDDEDTDGEDKSLQMMQTDEDPLLQETFNALINGTGGIEVVDTSERISPSAEQSISGGAGEDPIAAAGDGGPGEELAESDRNYECTYCGKLFTRSNTLAYHLKVHTGERPFKCKHCAKAFREHYRLVKHLKTHAKHGGCRERDRYRLERREERVRTALQASNRLVSSVSVKTTAGAAAGSPEEDYTTGDSERFFKTYELPDGPEAMKLEPDISLTVEGVSEGAVASMADVPMLEETVERCEEEEISAADEATTPLLAGEGTTDVRYQIIEERIKSLQREVHLVNQNLNRVESKVDGLTRMISLFIGKFEEDPAALGDASSGAAIVGGQTVTVESPLAPSSAATIPHSPAPPSPAPAVTVQAKTTVLLASTNHQNVHHHHQQHHLAVSSAQHPMVYGAGTVLSTISPLPTAVTQPSQPQTLVPERESRSSNVHSNNPAQFYHFGTAEQFHPKGQLATVTVKADRSLTPAPAQQTQLALGGGGNQLLDTFPDVPELPIRTVGDFLDLNDHCTDNEQFLLQMMIRLHSEIHNSQPFQRNIKRMMEALVTYEVLCQFSWSGKSAINGQYTKYVFGNSLGIIDLLTKTLNLGKSAKEAEANQKPIFAAIQSFIKHSRQNMIRDSRKRRDPVRSSLVGAAMATASAVADSTTPTGSYLVGPSQPGDCPPDRNLLIKQIKTEYQHHSHPEELVNPF